MKEYEIAILDVLVENTIYIDAGSESEAYEKALDMIDKAAKELGATVSYCLEIINPDEDEYEDEYEDD